MAKSITNIPWKKELALALALNVIPVTATMQTKFTEQQQAEDKTITISGQYLDKKGNPISTATATYYKDGIEDPQPFGVTGQDGNFEIIHTIVGLDNQFGTAFQAGQNFPNPYQDKTNIPIRTTGPTDVVIYNTLGQAAEQINIPFEGSWMISGDINSSGGTLPYTVMSHDGQRVAGKMIKMNSSQGGHFNLEQQASPTNMSVLKTKSIANPQTSEYIEFVKDNTSIKEYDVVIEEDTDLGIIIGNVGPTILDEIPTQNKTVGDTILLNLNQFIYNDDSPIYQSSNPNFSITSDSLLQYIATEAGNFSTTITVIDSADNALQKTLDLYAEIVARQNTAPTVKDMPDLVFNEDESFEGIDLDTMWTDEETIAANAVWTYEGNTNVNVSIDPETKIMSHSAAPNWFGSESITITGTDEGGLTDSQTYIVTVSPVYDAITQKTAIPDAAINEGEKQTITDLINTYINNPDLLSVSIAGITNSEGTPLSYAMNDANLEIETTNKNHDENLTNIIITLTDGTTNLNLTGYNLNITPVYDPITQKATITNDTINEGAKQILTEFFNTYVNNIDSLPVSITGITNTEGIPLSYAMNGNDLEIETTDENHDENLTNLLIALTDGTTPLNLNTYNLNIKPINDVPSVSGIPDKTFNEDLSDNTTDLDLYFTDVETIAENATWSYEGNTK
ncbi:hypothetical protein ACFLRQ_03340 [Bacteroidota bacterium]